MTRVNLVPASELCDQHLLAEHREITRIPNRLLRGGIEFKDIPQRYRLGIGHVKFFYDKTIFLKERYDGVHSECLRRGFKVSNRWPPSLKLIGQYKPTEDEVSMSRARIIERMPKSPRFTASQ